MERSITGTATASVAVTETVNEEPVRKRQRRNVNLHFSSDSFIYFRRFDLIRKNHAQFKPWLMNISYELQLISSIHFQLMNPQKSIAFTAIINRNRLWIDINQFLQPQFMQKMK
jgi:hypothetical protein